MFRHYIGQFISKIINIMLNLNIEACDTQAGLKGFKKFKNFNNVKFLSKKFFFDLELISLYSKKNFSIKSVKTNYSVPSKSSIKIFNFSKNFEILCELIKVIKKYK